jgi:hypothetical protein
MLRNMARFILAFILCSSMTTAFSQGTLTPTAPDAVLKAFIKNYGDVKATWKEDEGQFEAAFRLNGMPATAWFDSTGYKTNVVVEIETAQVPAIAKSYIDRNYPKAKITKALKWTDDKKVNTFQTEIKAGAEIKNLLFTSRGDLIKELGKE